jgi:Domain of unknown function (DUF5655)
VAARLTVTDGWTCPLCGRRFARPGQVHVCAEATTLDEYFANARPHERPVFQAVYEFLSTLGPIHVEPVAVGIFLKKRGSFVELRPKSKWVAMSFPMPRRVRHRRITRKPIEAGAAVYHFANLRTPDDLDEALQEILAESYDFVE